MDTLFRSFRFALRRLRKDPVGNLIAVLAMALGIGLTAGVYAIIDGLIIRGLPFEEPEQLVQVAVQELREDDDDEELSQHDFEAFLAHQTQFSEVVGWHDGTMNLSDEDLPERYSGAWISTNFTELVRTLPVVGRPFQPSDAEPGAEKVALIGYGVWQSRYGGQSEIVGRQVRINSESVRLVGVMPEGFRFPENHDLWMPLTQRGASHPRGSGELSDLDVIARLRADAELDEAVMEASILAKRLEREFPATNEGLSFLIRPYIEEIVDHDTRRLVGVMFAAVVLVLLIACFNVANLLIGRSAIRGRELAIRSALGSRGRHAMLQIFAEALVLAGLGASLGLVGAQVGIAAFDAAIQKTEPPYWIHFYLSPAVFAAAAGFTLLAALVSGFVPAVQATKTDVRQVLADGFRGSTSFNLGRLSRVLVITQVAASTALAIGAGLAIRGVLEVQSFDHAFDEERLITARVGLFEGDYPEDQDRLAFFERLKRTLDESGELEQVAFGTVLPTEMAIGAGGIHFERPGELYDGKNQRPWSRQVMVSPGYFRTLGVPVLAGRDFAAADREGSSAVAIVNQSFAEREWPGENPLGRQVDLWMGEEAEAVDADAGVVRVVGVVPDLRFSEFDNADDQHGIYLPMGQQAVRFAWIIGKTRQHPAALKQSLRRWVQKVDPNLPLYYVRTMDEVLEQTLMMPRVLGSLFSLFGAASLCLACVGLYGLMSFTVSRRSQEMGVRVALGAQSRDLISMVLGQGLRQTLIGLAVGLVFGAMLGSFLSKFLFQVQALDVATYATVPSLLLGVTVLAGWLPARRAASVDPMTVLNRD